MHGPSSTGEQRGCRGLCPGLAYERLRGCLSLVALVPCLANPSLTDAPNAICSLAYPTTLALAKGVGGDPHFQVDPGLLLEITREAFMGESLLPQEDLSEASSF